MNHRRGFLQTTGLLGAALRLEAQKPSREIADELTLNYHLMHPGERSAPGDPNPIFFLEGRYHLHYILAHPFRGKTSFCFIHVSSPDMLHWQWHKTRLQPSFTGHGMFSGTGFITKEGKPAAIYHGQNSGRNQIAIARDNTLEAWEKPYPVEPLTTDGRPAPIPHWDPDCFRIGDTYYATSGGAKPAVMKSKDLRNWLYVGDLLKHDLPDVAIGEDVSCGNLFPIGSKWMLLCISHWLGCRYYIGEWDAKAEQFVPESHGRMNWRREDQSIHDPGYRDFFAPESVLTPDGRRVMWAWCVTFNKQIEQISLQSLPRELSLAADNTLRIRPLRELESLRYDQVTLRDLEISPQGGTIGGGSTKKALTTLPGEAVELRIVIARAEAERKRFGFQLFADEKQNGLPIVFLPETGRLRLGSTEAPFAVHDLPPGEDVELRIFIDKYLVEIFVNNRQAMIAAQMDYAGRTGFAGYSFGGPARVRSIDIWKLRATNQGFLEAKKNRIWEPATE